MPTKNSISRRQFLGSAAAAAVPLFIPSGVLAAPGRPGANDRIGIAGIGIGRQGSGDLASCMKDSRSRFIAIADVNLPRANQIAKKYSGEPYQDYRKLLDRKDVDAVITATVDHWRAIVSIHTCQTGKHVYAEKPLTLTIREGRLMVEAARKYNRVFQAGSQQRSMAINRATCEYIRSGKLGKITQVIGSNYPSPWDYKLPSQPVPEGLDWDMWCGPAPLVPFHADLYTPRPDQRAKRVGPGWISFRLHSGGEMTGWGAHGLDQIQCALGMDDTGPVEIWTEGGKFDPPTYTQPESRDRGEKICKSPMVHYRYANGVTVKLDNGNEGGGIFIGEKGKIDLARGRVRSNPAEIAQEITKHAGRNQDHIKNWLDCIQTGDRPAADVEIGHRSATVCHLGNIARWTGRRLRWDPVKETFPDDDAACAYLDRERRKPYLLPETV
jgi:predicted dehydrogenase